MAEQFEGIKEAYLLGFEQKLVDGVLRVVTRHFKTDLDSILVKTRRGSAQMARSTAAYLLRKVVKLSWKQIAVVLKYGDHSSACSAVRTVTKRAGKVEWKTAIKEMSDKIVGDNYALLKLKEKRSA